jgi:DnaJ-class molecular chaperone
VVLERGNRVNIGGGIFRVESVGKRSLVLRPMPGTKVAKYVRCKACKGKGQMAGSDGCCPICEGTGRLATCL